MTAMSSFAGHEQHVLPSNCSAFILSLQSNTRALILGIGFWAILNYKGIKEHQNSMGKSSGESLGTHVMNVSADTIEIQSFGFKSQHWFSVLLQVP